VTYEPIDPPELGAPRGFTNGMLAPAGGRVLVVAGQDAAEPDGVVGDADFVAQFSTALRKTLAVVHAAGGRPEDVGRLTIYVTDLAEYRARRRELGETWRALMGRHYPAMALVHVQALVDPAARVEIEATAVLPDDGA
jgi:enamine deaminase RidA (YjgF/YER057c/UK114 family)